MSCLIAELLLLRALPQPNFSGFCQPINKSCSIFPCSLAPRPIEHFISPELVADSCRRLRDFTFTRPLTFSVYRWSTWCPKFQYSEEKPEEA